MPASHVYVVHGQEREAPRYWVRLYIGYFPDKASAYGALENVWCPMCDFDTKYVAFDVVRTIRFGRVNVEDGFCTKSVTVRAP